MSKSHTASPIVNDLIDSLVQNQKELCDLCEWVRNRAVTRKFLFPTCDGIHNPSAECSTGNRLRNTINNIHGISYSEVVK